MRTTERRAIYHVKETIMIAAVMLMGVALRPGKNPAVTQQC
jgi:hypothetical protein